MAARQPPRRQVGVVAPADDALAATEEERRGVEELDAPRAHLEARAAELADELARTGQAPAAAAAELRRADRRAAGDRCDCGR